jgi:UDP-3-O-[3-hydroxymyristoyl] glucosamine N-acyltransferase
VGIGKSLKDLGAYVGGKVIGDGDVVIHKVAAIDEAGPGEITFLNNPRYQRFLPKCRASAVIVGTGVVKAANFACLNFLETADPYIAFAKILNVLVPQPQYNGERSAEAHIDSSADLGDGVTVFPNAFVGARAKIGHRSVLFPGVYIGAGVVVGDDCLLYPNVVVREGCQIGHRVILHPGAVIGSDGFGYAGTGAERVKIPQVGVVVLEDDVEIGANTTVDRATLGKTTIKHGTKIDNLVQIAHNVVVGEDSVIAAQTGIAGSTRLGRNVTLAGQVGVVNHIQIGDGATIGPQTGVPKSVPSGAVLSGGIGATPHHEWLKVMTLLPQLPSLWNSVRRMEKQVARMIRSREKEIDRDAGR